MLKNILFIFFCLSLVELQAHEAQSPQDMYQQNGRYQISTNSRDKTSTEIYLLDTRNGKIWMTSSFPWGYYYSWSQLPSLPDEDQ